MSCYESIWLGWFLIEFQVYGQRRSLILNVLIKWGIFIRLLTSVLKNQQVLLNYFQQKKLGIDQGRKYSLINIINDYFFWKRLIIVKKILDFIHKIQYMFEVEGHKLYTIAINWNKIRSYLYSMANETDDETDLQHIVDVIWENRYFHQIDEFHVTAVLLLSQNHVIKMIEVIFEHTFFSLMHKFFHRYLIITNAAVVMKEWFVFRDQEHEFHVSIDCWSYQKNLDFFWNFCNSFSFVLSKIARKVMILFVNSIMTEKSWSIMNFIMNKTRNFLNITKVDKLMFIYINERTFNRFVEMRKKLQFVEIDINEIDLCEMKDNLLRTEISVHETSTLFEMTSFSSLKRSASQTLKNWGRGDMKKGKTWRGKKHEREERHEKKERHEKEETWKWEDKEKKKNNQNLIV